jgi:hypothetical protein
MKNCVSFYYRVPITNTYFIFQNKPFDYFFKHSRWNLSDCQVAFEPNCYWNDRPQWVAIYSAIASFSKTAKQRYMLIGVSRQGILTWNVSLTEWNKIFFFNTLFALGVYSSRSRSWALTIFALAHVSVSCTPVSAVIVFYNTIKSHQIQNVGFSLFKNFGGIE